MKTNQHLLSAFLMLIVIFFASSCATHDNAKSVTIEELCINSVDEKCDFNQIPVDTSSLGIAKRLYSGGSVDSFKFPEVLYTYFQEAILESDYDKACSVLNFMNAPIKVKAFNSFWERRMNPAYKAEIIFSEMKPFHEGYLITIELRQHFIKEKQEGFIGSAATYLILQNADKSWSICPPSALLENK